ncbi:MAG: hypothetical protein J6V80_05385 [Clostridia bacterium]|nr:hypothetical protein [Clostridia bacterium]
MSGNFLKFKRRRNLIRAIKAVMLGVSCGLVASGVWLILSKLTVIAFEPISSLYVGLGALVVVGALAFLLDRRSDKALAEELDATFDLQERVQTMIAYKGDEGDMLSIQRQDADLALSKIPTGKYKFKRLWVYIIALLLSTGVLAGGFLVKDMRGYVPPVEVEPFELSAFQEAGISNLINYVAGSDMEEEFKTAIVDELSRLLTSLREITTQPEMLEAVNGSMSVIRDITYLSSTATEVLNALWETEDIYFRNFAKTLDTSNQDTPDRADFDEKWGDYYHILWGDTENPEEAPKTKSNDSNSSDSLIGKDRVKLVISTTVLKLEFTFKSSGVDNDDEIISAINSLYYDEAHGLNALLNKIDDLDEDEAEEALKACFGAHGTPLYNAISLNKTNANVGEYAMIRLSALFIVPLPEFERPDFVKNGESIGGGHQDTENPNQEGSGGVGEGATYGSDDMVLDPLTGEYVSYGALLDKYYAIMYEKLEGGSYTEEQKEIIKKYFGLLYSGIEK